MAKLTNAQMIELALVDEFVAQGIWDLVDVDAYMRSKVE